MEERPSLQSEGIAKTRGASYCRDPMPMRYVLYQRDYCHLCDQALAVMAEARAPDFDSLWVDDDEALEQRYGTRVPVLRDSHDGRELDWPFDAAAVRAFVDLPL
jgi:hypothetical protein